MPTHIHAVQDRGASALACMLLEAGLLPASLREADPKQIGGMCRAALQQWLDERAAGFRVLGLNLSLRDDRQYSWPEGARSGVLLMSCYAGEVASVCCADTLARLRRLDERLPREVLQRIEAVAWKGVPVLSCSDQLGLAEWLLWGGCESPEEHADECEFEAEDRSSYLESVLTRKAILEATPEWVADARWNAASALTDADIDALAANTVDPLCSQILFTLKALTSFESPAAAFHKRVSEEDGGQFVGFGALLRYSLDDHLPQLGEELGNYAMESGEGYDTVLMSKFEFGWTEEMVEQLDRVEAWLRACRLEDHLLWLLGGADSLYGGSEA